MTSPKQTDSVKLIVQGDFTDLRVGDHVTVTMLPNNTVPGIVIGLPRHSGAILLHPHMGATPSLVLNRDAITFVNRGGHAAVREAYHQALTSSPACLAARQGIPEPHDTGS